MSFSSKCSGISSDKISDFSAGSSNQVKLNNVKETLGDSEKSRFSKPKAHETVTSPSRSGLKAPGLGLPSSSFKKNAIRDLPKINTAVQGLQVCTQAQSPLVKPNKKHFAEEMLIEPGSPAIVLN